MKQYLMSQKANRTEDIGYNLRQGGLVMCVRT